MKKRTTSYFVETRSRGGLHAFENSQHTVLSFRDLPVNTRVLLFGFETELIFLSCHFEQEGKEEGERCGESGRRFACQTAMFFGLPVVAGSAISVQSLLCSPISARCSGCSGFRAK